MPESEIDTCTWFFTPDLRILAIILMLPSLSVNLTALEVRLSKTYCSRLMSVFTKLELSKSINTFFYFNIFHFDFVFLDIKDFIDCFFDIEHTVMLDKLCIVFAQDREIKNIVHEIVNKFGCTPHLIRTLLEASVNLGKAVNSLLGESVSGFHVFN